MSLLFKEKKKCLFDVLNHSNNFGWDDDRILKGCDGEALGGQGSDERRR